MSSTTPKQTLNRLTFIVAVQWMGATLGLPLLPLFLENRGGTPTIIGYIMAAFSIAGLASQFLTGRFADKHGRRPIMIIGLVVYGLASMTYLFPVSAPWFIITRIFQGVSAGAIEVASMSAVSALFDESERGSAISRIIAAQLGGMAFGPVAGALVSVRALGWAFFASGVVSLLAATQTFRTNLGDKAYDPSPLPKLRWNQQLIGAFIAAAGTGVLIGVYETCWSLLMKAHHATTLDIRLSWTFFCLPWVLLSGFGGWLADNANRRVVGTLGLVNGALFLALYPHIHNPRMMVVFGAFESIGASLSVPSISSLMSEGSEHREMSRRQGLNATANTGALALSAAVSGYFFSISESLPFTIGALVSGALALSTIWWWRNVKGNISTKKVSQ